MYIAESTTNNQYNIGFIYITLLWYVYSATTSSCIIIIGTNEQYFAKLDIHLRVYNICELHTFGKSEIPLLIPPDFWKVCNPSFTPL